MKLAILKKVISSVPALDWACEAQESFSGKLPAIRKDTFQGRWLLLLHHTSHKCPLWRLLPSVRLHFRAQQKGIFALSCYRQKRIAGRELESVPPVLFFTCKCPCLRSKEVGAMGFPHNIQLCGAMNRTWVFFWPSYLLYSSLFLPQSTWWAA